DFDFNNRSYRVYVQADQQFRSSPNALKQLYARTTAGEMVPLSTVVRMHETTAPSVISHFNLFRSAEISGNPAPGLSSGQGLAAMEDLASRLPKGYWYAWAGQSLEEKKSGTQAFFIFGLSVVLVYLILAAQYESFILPLIILLGVPLAVFGALFAQWMRGFSNDVFCQVGLVLLIGLAAKNSILIVEFAEQLRGQGMSIIDAAVESSRIRLRPILMTSFAFILGVLPLAFATGAGAAGRQSIGTTVAGGMVASTLLSIIFIPLLYVVIRTLAPGRAHRAHDDDEGSEASASGHGAAVKAGVAVLLILSMVAPISAQTQTASIDQPVMESVTFEQAIARAIEKNPTVGIAAANVLRSQGLLAQTRSDSRPRLVGNINNSTLNKAIAFDTGVVQPRNQSTFSFTLSAPILAASQWAATSQARDRVELTRLSGVNERKQVAVSAADAYLAVISHKRLVEISQRSLETGRSQFDYNRKRREGGLGSRLNELRSGQLVATDETMIETFKLGLRRAQEALGVVLGENGPIDTNGEPTFEVTAGLEADWMAERTDLRLRTAEQDAAKRILHGSNKDWWPTLTASFDPQYVTPNGLFQQSKSWRLSFQLSQTIYNGGLRDGVNVERKANLQVADLALTQAQLQARSEVRNARTAVEAYERVLASARQAAEQSSEVLKITITAFDAGASTNIEVIEAQKTTRDVETALAQAEDSLRQARFELLVALGRFPKP
ncbi:MAG: efflux RND transporter permease subunit, partial [Vicinamibacteria bacterium]